MSKDYIYFFVASMVFVSILFFTATKEAAAYWWLGFFFLIPAILAFSMRDKRMVKITKIDVDTYKMYMRLSLFGHLEADIYPHIMWTKKTWAAHVINKKFWRILEDFKMSHIYFLTADIMINTILKHFAIRAGLEGEYSYTSLPELGEITWAKLEKKENPMNPQNDPAVKKIIWAIIGISVLFSALGAVLIQNTTGQYVASGYAFLLWSGAMLFTAIACVISYNQKCKKSSTSNTKKQG